MEIVKVNPQDFGLEQSKGSQIENEFAPVISEFTGLFQIYDEIIKSEITDELSLKAGKLITQLSHCNGAMDRIHKSQKAYYLAGGNFVDAIKRKNKDVIKEMQDMLIKIRDHKKIMEAQRITILQQERANELSKYQDYINPDLGEMPDSIWENFIAGVKHQHELKLEEERKAEEARKEQERINQLRSDRREKLINSDLLRFMNANEKVQDLGLITAPLFNELETELKSRKSEYEAEQERIRKENERLQKEAEEQRKKAEAERKAREEKEAKERAEREAKEKADREAYEAKLKAEREEKERIQKELEAKAEAERKAKAEEDARIEAELKKGDNEKMVDLVNDLGNLKEKYSFKSKESNAKWEQVKNKLIDAILILQQ